MTGNTLRVVSIFHTIQGEGPFTGRPAVFVRLHGCNLACTFCDTEFNNQNDPILSVEEVVQEVLDRGHNASLVVFTGGEPLLQAKALYNVIQALGEGWTFQFETNGTVWSDVLLLPNVYTVVSPKAQNVHPEFYGAQDPNFSWKYVVAANEEEDAYGLPVASCQPNQRLTGRSSPFLGAPYKGEETVYVQPRDDKDPEKNKANVKHAVDLCLRYGYTLSLQVHKIIGVE